jgi:hypothetical protein
MKRSPDINVTDVTSNRTWLCHGMHVEIGFLRLISRSSIYLQITQVCIWSPFCFVAMYILQRTAYILKQISSCARPAWNHWSHKTNRIPDQNSPLPSESLPNGIILEPNGSLSISMWPRQANEGPRGLILRSTFLLSADRKWFSARDVRQLIRQDVYALMLRWLWLC